MTTIKRYGKEWFIMRCNNNILCAHGFKSLMDAQKWMNDNYPNIKYRFA